MTSQQENTLSMCRAVVLFSLDPIWTLLIGTVPAMSNAYAEIAHLLPTFDTDAEGQTSSTFKKKGATADKKQRRSALVIAVNAVSGPLYALGDIQGDHEMKAVANVSPSKLTAMRDDILTSRATSIHVLATAHAAALVSQGVTAAILNNLQAKIAAWSANTQVPRQHIATGKGHALALTNTLKSMTGILKERLDRLMLPFKASHPSFYAVYKASRVIYDHASGQNPPPAPPTP